MIGSDPFLEKAQRYIRSAQLLAAEGDYDSAASRVFYAMLYVTQSLLEFRSLSFTSHRAAISAFGQYFAKTNEIDPYFHRALMNAFSQRQLGDYTVQSGIRSEDVDQLLTDAVAFFEAAVSWLEKNPSSKLSDE